jgi:hypothetical protein
VALANRLFWADAPLIITTQIRTAIGILIQYFIVSVRCFGQTRIYLNPTTFRIKTLGDKGKMQL